MSDKDKNKPFEIDELDSVFELVEDSLTSGEVEPVSNVEFELEDRPQLDTDENNGLQIASELKGELDSFQTEDPQTERKTDIDFIDIDDFDTQSESTDEIELAHNEVVENEPLPQIDDTPEAEVVVTGGDDDQFLPTEVALARDEIEGAPPLDLGIKFNDDAKEKSDGPRRGLLGGLLAVIRAPENALKTAFGSKSTVEPVTESVDTDDGHFTVPPDDSRGGFVTNNLLLTGLMLAGLYFGASFAMNHAMEVNAVREVVGLKRVDDGTTTLAEGRQVRSQARLSNKRREAIAADLEHCSITKEARERMLASIDNDGRLGNDQLRISFSAIKRFRDTFTDKSLEGQIRAAQDRRELIVREVRPVYAQLMSALQDANARREEVHRQWVQVNNKLKAITKNAGSVSISDVNRTIKVRDELESYESKLASMPQQEGIDFINNMLERLRAAFDGSAKAMKLGESTSLPTPDWVRDIHSVDNEALVVDIREFVNGPLAVSERRLRHTSWSIVTNEYAELAHKLNFLIRSLEEIDTQPVFAIRQLDRIQDSVNQQLGKGLGTSGMQWVNFRDCLDLRSSIVDNLDD